MSLHRDAAKRFHRFTSFAWTILNLSQREILERAGIDHTRRVTLWRASIGASTELTEAEAHQVVGVLAVDSPLELDPELVWAWVIGKARIPYPDLQELLACAPLFPNPRNLRKLLAEMKEYDSISREKITCTAVPPISALPAKTVMAVHRYVTRPFGERGRRLLTGLNDYSRERQKLRFDRRESGPTETRLVLASNMRAARDGKGPYADLSTDDRVETFEQLALNTVELGHFFGIIDDSIVPLDLLARFRRFDGIFITDQRFLMKVHVGGIHRSVCANISAASAAYIAQELAKLRELKRFVRHDWTPDAMREAILGFSPGGTDPYN